MGQQTRMTTQLTITGLRGVPLVQAGDDLAAIALAAYAETGIAPEDGDVLVVAQKIVSKAEGRIVDVSSRRARRRRPGRSPPRSRRTRALSKSSCRSRGASCGIARI